MMAMTHKTGDLMFLVGTPLFLLVPDSSRKRILHPGKVVRCEEGAIIAQIEEAMTVAEGMEVVVFCSVRGKFMQQGATVIAQGEPAIKGGFAFKLVGEAVSAESRQTYRVSVAVANVKAQIGKEKDCLIVDVSPEGFAVITRSEDTLGSSVQVNFCYEGQTVSTPARVQTVQTRADGKFHCGLLVIEKGSSARKALAQISGAMQRQQLKRLSAAA
jgi:hypothetical protein